MKMIFVILAFTVLFTSCAVKPLYYWGDYSKSYYNYVKVPGQESTEKRMEALEEIINKTEKSSKKNIGPGVYAEYAYLLLDMGQYEKANNYLMKEKEMFPESQIITDFITPKK